MSLFLVLWVVYTRVRNENFTHVARCRFQVGYAAASFVRLCSLLAVNSLLMFLFVWYKQGHERSTCGVGGKGLI